MEEAINDANVNDDIVKEAKQSFAAVPIHFRPKEGKSKLIKLVIPGIEPPLGFFEVSGGTPEELTLKQTDGPSAVNQEDGDGIEDEVDKTETENITPESNEEDETDISESDDTEQDDHPHETDQGEPVAGFLLGSEEHQPLVILVHPSDGQTSQEAMEEKSKQHPEHRLGTLEEATALLGHSPLTSEDNWSYALTPVRGCS